MADEIGEMFAEQLGGVIVPNENSANEAMVVDLSTPEPTPEPTTSTTEETPTENKSSETSTEETQVEAKVENLDNSNRSLNNESSDQPKQEVSPAKDIEQNKKEFLSFVNDQFKTNFDSIDSFNEALSTKKTSFANEQIEKMNTFVSDTGRGIADYIRTQTVDYSKMSNEDVMKVSIKQNNPELTIDEVNILVASKYKTDKDKHSEADQTLGKIELKTDVSKARKELIEMQDKYRTPVENKENSTENEAVRSDWVKDMSSEVDEVDSITFDINDSGEQFTFSLTNDHRKDLVDANSNLNDFFGQYTKESGDWDFDRLNTDMFVLRNFQDIIRSVANQYRSKGTEQVVKDIKNPSFNNEPRQNTGESMSVMDQIDDIIYGENEGLRIR
tara:strand:- start:394 stop:1554 length:1161 start_codon:yes stop_codon:yes gene_type:complete